MEDNKVDFIDNIVSLQDLIPEPIYAYIDLKDNVFVVVVEVLTSKAISLELSKEDNFKRLLDKPFVEFHEKVLYGISSCRQTDSSIMNILDIDDIIKILDIGKIAMERQENYGVFGISAFDYFNIELSGETVFEKSGLLYDNEEESHIIKLAYKLENINTELIRHALDETLYELD